MNVFKSAVVWCLLVLLVPAACEAREWTDASGQFAWEGELFAASADTVVIRNDKGQLQAVVIKELSEADQSFVQDYLSMSTEAKPDDPAKLQTWTTRDDFKVRGRVIGYKSGPVEIHERSGAFYINSKRMRELDEVYQYMLPKLVAETEDRSVKDLADFKRWVRKKQGRKWVTNVDGVLMRMESGEEFAVPLFLFAESERFVLDNGWERWKAEETTRQEREQEDFLVRAEAEAYQREREAEARKNQQMQMLHLGLLAANAGVTALWEVQMFPGNGIYGRPVVVVVAAENSNGARAIAMQRYRGYTAGATRQISRR